VGVALGHSEIAVNGGVANAPHADFVVVAFTTTTTKGESPAPPWNPLVWDKATPP